MARGRALILTMKKTIATLCLGMLLIGMVTAIDISDDNFKKWYKKELKHAKRCGDIIEYTDGNTLIWEIHEPHPKFEKWCRNK